MAKRYYFTNLDFAEIAWDFPSKKLHFGVKTRVFGRELIWPECITWLKTIAWNSWPFQQKHLPSKL